MPKDLEEIFSLAKDLKDEDKKLVEKAYHFAKAAHEGQMRLSGDPYLTHLVETAKNLAVFGMDATTIAAGLLHDILEDTVTKAEDLEKEFGSEVRFIVEGVSKLGTYKYRGTDRYNESLRKFLFATSKDLRVLMVKLCDRLHNVKTLSYVPPEKQKRIAMETLQIYAPIGSRLGIRKLSRELEDLAFPFADPEGYKEISSIFKKSYEEKMDGLQKFRNRVLKELAQAGFSGFRSDYRVKGLYSLYKKYLKYKKDIEVIHDLMAMRIILPTAEDCYKALGIIHSQWKPLPGRIKDYISRPKLNGYQSLHTTVFTGDGNIVEVQFRTEEMHEEAEYGVAAHSVYKAGEKNKRHLMPWIEALSSGSLSEIKKDFLSERIFVFTPKGDVIDLPVGASCIDFAYSIHSDLGDKMSGAKINGKLSPLTTMLKGGEIIEILTSKSAKPNRKWLEHVKTSLAKKKIKLKSS